MFITTQEVNLSEENSIKLHFINSSNVRVYPCGRRRAQKDQNNNIFIPFDPEARLNTEANNIKHSSLNGFTQTFADDWCSKKLNTFSLTLAGYNFEINLVDSADKNNVLSVEAFVKKLLGEDAANTATHIYANILLEETPLFNSEDLSYTTWILRDMSNTDTAKDSLDIGISDNPQGVDDYYFAGLSFSTSPYTGITATRSELPYTNTRNKRIISLRVLERVGSTWQVHQSALLPHIEHGSTVSSVNVPGSFNANTISADTISRVGVSVPSLSLMQEGDSWKLCFSPVDIKNK